MNYDRIILELIDRVSKLEIENLKKNGSFEVESTDSSMEGNSGRDTTKYFLD